MNQNNDNNSNSNSNSTPQIPLRTKAAYVGVGVILGLAAYPFVKNGLKKIQPKIDEWLDALTGKAESFAEKASDVMAKAKENIKKNQGKEKESHTHTHATHSHAHDGENESDESKGTTH